MKLFRRQRLFHIGHTIITIICLTTCIWLGCQYKKLSFSPTYALRIFKSQAELDYYAAKDRLVHEVDRYIDSIAPRSLVNGLAVVDACLDDDIDIKFVLAQGHIESHFGTTGTAAKTHSIFNVCAYDGVSARELVKKGKCYEHPDLSIKPFIKLLLADYMVDGKSEYDLMKKYINKNGHRYASNPSYEKDIMRTFVSIEKNTKISELYQEMEMYRIIAGK